MPLSRPGHLPTVASTTPMPATAGRRRRGGRPDDRERFGLSPDAVRPLFGPWNGPRPGMTPTSWGAGIDAAPYALAVYEPGLSHGQRLLARLGTSRTVAVGLHRRPVSTKALVCVSVGAVTGMMVAQPFDVVTFMAPLYGLALGSLGGAAGWVAVRGRRATTIAVADWRPQLDAIGRILGNADRIGQPFVSPPALRTALHSALWHAINAVGQPGDHEVVMAFDEQLAALRDATEATVAELESPSIADRKAAVSERLAAAVSELELAPTVLRQVDAGDGTAE